PCWTHQPEVRAPFQGRGGRKGRRNGPPSSQVLFLVYKVTAPVLLPALLVRLGAERFLLDVADRLDSAGIDSRRGQGVLYGIGTIVTQGQVVFRRAALVTVSLNREVDVGMLSQELRARLNGCRLVSADVVLVVIEVDVLHILREQLFFRCARSGRGRRGSSDGYACRCFLCSAGPLGRQTVGR